MLEAYHEIYANTNKQFVLVNKTGVVLESDKTLFNIEKGGSIFEFHPFFESLSSVFDSIDNEMNFFCVHIDTIDQEFVVDIKIISKKEGLLLIIKDLSDHYNSYQTLTQTRNESVIKNELTLLKNQELQEREQFKNSFIQNFSHELRNPLTSIMAIIDLLGDTKLTFEQSQMLDFLKESNTNLSLMLEDTLSIGMIDAGKLEIQESLFDLSKFFELIKFTYSTKAKKKGLKFESSWDIKIPKVVKGDRLRLFQVATNLLDNAIKFTEKGSIKFDVLLNQKRANLLSLRFQVSDTGLGISEENTETVFESFNQVPLNLKRKGVGLGLTISKKLLKLMGSSIKLRSKLGEGSLFYFDISLEYPLFQTTEKVSKQGRLATTNSEVKNQPKSKVLLVEDDEYVQTTLFKILLNTNQFHIDLAYDGALVLQEVINNDYDLILMDVNIPNLDGIQLTRLIRDFPFKNIRNIPIIGITANAYPDNIDQCLKAGMQKVLVKPFEKEKLLNVLFKALK